MRSGIRNKRAAITIVLLLLLVSVSLAAVSCGRKESGTTTTGQSQVKTGDATIDGYLEQLDSQVNSVSPDDFDQQKLNNDQLGL